MGNSCSAAATLDVTMKTSKQLDNLDVGCHRPSWTITFIADNAWWPLWCLAPIAISKMIVLGAGLGTPPFISQILWFHFARLFDPEASGCQHGLSMLGRAPRALRTPNRKMWPGKSQGKVAQLRPPPGGDDQPMVTISWFRALFSNQKSPSSQKDENASRNSPVMFETWSTAAVLPNSADDFHPMILINWSPLCSRSFQHMMHQLCILFMLQLMIVDLFKDVACSKHWYSINSWSCTFEHEASTNVQLCSNTVGTVNINGREL